jgi:hypothetical protein
MRKVRTAAEPARVLPGTVLANGEAERSAETRDGNVREEDANLEGAGSLERGQPTFRFFETLEYREQNLRWDYPEVPERRAERTPGGGSRRKPGEAEGNGGVTQEARKGQGCVWP